MSRAKSFLQLHSLVCLINREDFFRFLTTKFKSLNFAAPKRCQVFSRLMTHDPWNLRIAMTTVSSNLSCCRGLRWVLWSAFTMFHLSFNNVSFYSFKKLRKLWWKRNSAFESYQAKLSKAKFPQDCRGLFCIGKQPYFCLNCAIDKTEWRRRISLLCISRSPNST